MGADFKIGDTVRVTHEGVVERIGKIPGNESAVELKIIPINGDYVQYVDTKNVESIEKIKPPVEVFGPGDVVRSKSTGWLYMLDKDGMYTNSIGSRHRVSGDEFHSGHFERV